ncbi:hypothetical protein E1A91_A04G067800v1 [Gossypium mustelinum]|uniref:Uncharacterized protein n=2 Tax=Gossypium TaxID=3633 RepID=A0A5D2ZN20_GOSMU|nr:hypothetical protein ES332_A04G072000v1 [Gossypium tomentosum]TYJ39400.1 hypothetical protein E1A91_A04G067800v1 [Gossypium mustelinum]
MPHSDQQRPPHISTIKNSVEMSTIVPYIAPPPSLPPPVGYPMTNGTGNPQQAAPPVHMQSMGDDFWKGW